MRVTNIDTLSALLDRLITERIKEYNFEKAGNVEHANHQREVISNVLKKLSLLFKQVYMDNNYNYIGERRTFDEKKLIADVETLITNDLDVGDAYYTKTNGEPTLEKFMTNELRLRSANESRGRMKNSIDSEFKNLIENDGDE